LVTAELAAFGCVDSPESDASAVNLQRIKALAEVRHRVTREGYCYHHVQAIIVAIDQYAEAAFRRR
jgi:hypothetical protein